MSKQHGYVVKSRRRTKKKKRKQKKSNFGKGGRYSVAFSEGSEALREINGFCGASELGRRVYGAKLGECFLGFIGLVMNEFNI